MKPQTVEDGALYEKGFFVFELDGTPDRPFVVKADGAIVPMDPDGRYRLRKAPTHIEIERCAGPFYSPPLQYFLAQRALLALNRRILAAHARMRPRTIPAIVGEGPVDRDVVRKVPAGEAK